MRPRAESSSVEGAVLTLSLGLGASRMRARPAAESGFLLPSCLSHGCRWFTPL